MMYKLESKLPSCPGLWRSITGMENVYLLKYGEVLQVKYVFSCTFVHMNNTFLCGTGKESKVWCVNLSVLISVNMMCQIVLISFSIKWHQYRCCCLKAY